jgi:hypothetical protein
VFDPFERCYQRVPALDQEYTQGLSLWKHRIIRQAVLEEQAQVDPVALGLAKRKIQAIVDDGRQRKRQGTRTHMARWEMAGQSTRVAVQREPPAQPEGPVQLAPVTEVTTPSPISRSHESPDDDNWEVCYVPLKSLPAPVKAQETEVHHG